MPRGQIARLVDEIGVSGPRLDTANDVARRGITAVAVRALSVPRGRARRA
jgi:hypothetical protein